MKVRYSPTVFAEIANLALLGLTDPVWSFDPQIDPSFIVADGFTSYGSQIFIEDTQQLPYDPPALVTIGQFVRVPPTPFECHAYPFVVFLAGTELFGRRKDVPRTRFPVWAHLPVPNTRIAAIIASVVPPKKRACRVAGSWHCLLDSGDTGGPIAYRTGR